MSDGKKTESFMDKLAGFIVDKRKAFYLVFLAAVIFCGASINKVVVNNDITTYLPTDTETRRGLTLMDEEFTTCLLYTSYVDCISMENSSVVAMTGRPGHSSSSMMIWAKTSAQATNAVP